MTLPTKPETLADAYPIEQARLREVIAEYEEAGKLPNCYVGFALAGLRDLQRRADKAAAEHDTVAMLRCYAEMKGCK